MHGNRREFLLLLTATARASARLSLSDQWRKIAAATDGTVGAAALHLSSGRAAFLNAGQRFPLASVCKVPIAMRALELADKGLLHRKQNIEILPQDVWPSWPGDLGHRWPKEDKLPLDELIRLMIVESDNTAVQTLFRIVGERPGMQSSLEEWKIDGLRVDRYEGQCSLSAHGVVNPPPVTQWTPGLISKLNGQVPVPQQYTALRQFLLDPRDTATPSATVQLLAKLSTGLLLSTSSSTYLIEVMSQTTTGQQRLKGLLPHGTAVAHKTGTSATIRDLNGATNDVGLILPGTPHEIAIAVYLKGSTRSEATRDRITAEIARAAYDQWVIQPSHS